MKILNIAWKEIATTFRDKPALITMLAAPFALTLVMLFAFGSSGSVDIENIPVVIVNQDGDTLGNALVQVFESNELDDLVEPIIVETAAQARDIVDSDKAAAAVLIPAGLTATVIPGEAASEQTIASIEIYENPGRNISAQIIGAITDGFVNDIAAGYTSGRLAWEKLAPSGNIPLAELENIAMRVAQDTAQNPVITVQQTEETIAAAQENTGFNWAQYMGPSMAILFLMFSVARGGRSLLVEQAWGTMPRMLASPTRPAEILTGKVLGTFFTALLQMLILMAAMRLLMQVSWGPLLPVLAVILAVCLAATSWGMLIGTLSRTPAQAGNLGAALSLIFAAASGNFYPRAFLPEFLKKASRVTPNAWGLDAFQSLANGGGIQDVLTPIIGLLIMALVLGIISIIAFRRQYAGDPS